MLPDRLREGYAEFRSGRYAAERDRWQRLADSQKPDTMVIACCDSRAAPEIIFGAGPGELFVLRNVANLVPPYQPDSAYHSTSAAIEFAVNGLQVRHIVVMGHGRCGGIAAALATSMGDEAPSDFIGPWMSLVKPLAARCCAEHAEPSARQLALERASVSNSLANLRSFPWVDARVSDGRLSLHGAWFDIGLGELSALDQKAGRWATMPSAS